MTQVQEKKNSEEKIYSIILEIIGTSPSAKKKCIELCPKCIIGRCPKNYRCADITADPRYKNSCIIKK